jgi:rhomboid protease GluP
LHSSAHQHPQTRANADGGADQQARGNVGGGHADQRAGASVGIDAWQRFREVSSIDDAEKILIEMLQVEQKAHGFRESAVARFETATSPTRASDLAALAEHIETYILPLFAAAIDRTNALSSTKRPKIHEHLTTRQRVWQLLAEALRRDDSRLMAAHQQFWHGVSDLDLVTTAVEKARHASTNVEEQTAAFREALAVFTPRFIVTPTLAVINIALLIAALVYSKDVAGPNSQLLIDWGANFGPATLNGQWWRLFTCMFLHGSIIHVLMNMWVLFDFGRLVERLTGNVGFLVVYVISGLAGSLASLAWNPQVISVGASGAVFGIGGLLFGWTLLRRDSIPTAVLSHLRNSVGIFIVYNMLNMFRGGNIDHAAHAGGLVAGIVCGVLISQPLGPDVRARRWMKSLLTAVIGATILVGATFFLPPPPPAPLDLQGEMRAFAAAEERALATFQAMLDASRKNQLSNQQFADRLEQEILPAWSDARARLEKLRFEPRANQDAVAKAAQYASERDTAWRTFVAAAREDDDEKLKQAIAQWRAADETARRISQQ